MTARMESVERRVLFSIAGFDAGFGVDGVATPIKTGSVVGEAMPLWDGGSIVRTFSPTYVTDFRRLDANGRIVKSFGGGDGVMTPRGSVNLVAVDRATGRIAILRTVDDVPTVEFYKSKGTFERLGTSGTNGYNLRDATAMTFDLAGRLLVASDDVLTRILPSTGRADPAFGTNGFVSLPTDNLPAGEQVNAVPLRVVALLVRPASENNAGGDVTVIRDYTVGDSIEPSGSMFSQHLDVRRFDANGQPLTSGAVSTLRTGFSQRDDGAGQTLQESFEITSFAAAADGSIAVIGSHTQASFPTGQSGVKIYRETELRRIAGDRFVTRRGLDDITLTPRDANGTPTSIEMAIDAEGTRIAIVGNARIALFDARTLKPFTSENGPDGAISLTSRRFVRPTVDARGRLLLADGQSVWAVEGRSDNVVGAIAGQATLLRDGSLAVLGTSKADSVRIEDGTKRRIRVTVNGRVQNFDRNAVNGICARTAKGNDSIDASKLSGYTGNRLLVDGGSGDDTIIGSENGDTVLGGDGRDRFDGRAGLNLAFGFGEDDTFENADRIEDLLADPEEPLFA